MVPSWHPEVLFQKDLLMFHYNDVVNECDGVSNHQPHDCLLNLLFRRRPKNTSMLRVTGLCEGNSPVSSEFPAQMVSNAENVSIWWRHHVQVSDDVLPVITFFRRQYIKRESVVYQKCLTHFPWRKWRPFRRQYLRMHICEWKLVFWLKFHWSLFLGTNWH